MNIAEEHFDQLASAIANFVENVKDPKAEFISTFNYRNGTVCFSCFVREYNVLRTCADYEPNDVIL